MTTVNGLTATPPMKLANGGITFQFSTTQSTESRKAGPPRFFPQIGPLAEGSGGGWSGFSCGIRSLTGFEVVGSSLYLARSTYLGHRKSPFGQHSEHSDWIASGSSDRDFSRLEVYGLNFSGPRNQVKQGVSRRG